ncbi:Oidioi.mRNA.OKI2018_I69.PAR.g11596.t1.cds [Oikopleura dioica]|uniref:Oidioi.mRNA.OKI2018_I69.PAR.g11596.t1.cds n=1 Tax=Oikopleura dioica TaxID=34765 RepID=A0ABN7S0N2_OIKDI|nr:Oidioi.mRNA.OKI2018_I69.PAR.g11596.t1.cds [Oikopleura dioica]
MEKHPEEDEEFDKLDHILEQSGCLKELEESKECQYTHNDWRKCRETTQKLKDCMMKQQLERMNRAHAARSQK